MNFVSNVFAMAESNVEKDSSKPMSVYVDPPRVKISTGLTMYERVREHWKEHGKPFLKRALLYERPASLQPVCSKKRSIESPFASPPTKRFARECVPNGRDDIENGVNAGASAQSADKVEWKPISTRLVFAKIHYQSNHVGEVTIDQILAELATLTEHGEGTIEQQHLLRQVERLRSIREGKFASGANPCTSRADVGDRANKTELVSYCFKYNFDEESDASSEEASTKPQPLKLKGCPICANSSRDLYALLQHLRCCHPRFSFLAKEMPDRWLVEIRPVKFFDSRLETRLRNRICKRKAKPLPAKKVFTTVYYRPKENRAPTRMIPRKMEQFKTCPTDDSEYARSRAELLRNHPRQYYHSQTGQEMQLDELDDDSEDEANLEWTRNDMEKRIDAHTDAPESEKAIMKMWNFHVTKFNYFGDSRMEAACASFVAKNGRRILSQKLADGFAKHLAVLRSSGLLSEGQKLDLTQKLHAMMH